MLLSTITAKHLNSFVLLKLKNRDEQNHVRDWNVLNTAKKYDEILRIAEYYRSEGISNAVILSTSDELVVPPEESAKFFRVYYNLFTIEKVVVHLPLGGQAMGLVDRACDRFFDMARERWRRQGFDACIIDILDKYREETNKVIKRNKVSVITTFLIQLYGYNHVELQKDITKIILLEPSDSFEPKDRKKLLTIIWYTIQNLYEDDWADVLNEVNSLAEWNKANNEEDFPINQPIMGYPVIFSLENFKNSGVIIYGS